MVEKCKKNAKICQKKRNFKYYSKVCVTSANKGIILITQL